MRLRQTTIGIVLTALAACGGSDDEGGASTFCEKFQSAGEDLTDLAATDNPDDLNSRLDELDDIDPPDDIADPYRDLIAAYQAIADAESPTDPALAADLSEAQSNLTEIETYIRENCEIN
ncbi:MAG: hypothetical protein ACRD2C_14270 [Acidimicrobiales bacterium]